MITMLSANLRKQRMTPFQIYGRNYANYSPEIFQIKLMELYNQLNLMYETDSVDTKVQILSEISKKATC